MTESSESTMPRLRFVDALRGLFAAVLMAFGIMAFLFRGDMSAMAKYLSFIASQFRRPHWPDASPLIAGGPVILVHLATVSGALALGAALMLGGKGTRRHRFLGWVFLTLIIITAVTTLSIRRVNPGDFSFLHLFSLYVLIAGPLAILFARRGNLRAHSQMVRGIYFGAVWVAGLFAFLPGRIMWQVFFG